MWKLNMGRRCDAREDAAQRLEAKTQRCRIGRGGDRPAMSFGILQYSGSGTTDDGRRSPRSCSHVHIHASISQQLANRPSPAMAAREALSARAVSFREPLITSVENW